ncbi:MAG: hypothetical protein AB9869_20420 [Verrucomicrobiia bacterium]
MNLASIFPFHGHNLPALIAILFGVAFMCLVFKAARLVGKIVLFLTASALFAGAYWWITHIRS